MTEGRVYSDEVPGIVERAAKALLDGRGEDSTPRRIFEHSHVPMVVVDASRRYVQVNRRARLALGRDLEELRTLRIDDFTPSHLTRDVELAWARLLGTGSVAGRYQLAGRDGSRIDIIYG